MTPTCRELLWFAALMQSRALRLLLVVMLAPGQVPQHVLSAVSSSNLAYCCLHNP
jgi:hypothetical protein